MSSARSAGWLCLWGGLAFIPFAAAFRWLAVVTRSVPGLPGICTVLFWTVLGIVAICLAYAAWGLACGYNRTAWNAYARHAQKDTEKGAADACLRAGVKPPK